MSSDIKERLREAERISPHARMPQRLRYEALKRIEALESEVRVLKSDNEHHVTRCYAAEARAERLRVALETIAEEHDAGRHDGIYEACPAHEADVMFAIARKALEDKQ